MADTVAIQALTGSTCSALFFHQKCSVMLKGVLKLLVKFTNRGRSPPRGSSRHTPAGTSNLFAPQRHFNHFLDPLTQTKQYDMHLHFLSLSFQKTSAGPPVTGSNRYLSSSCLVPASSSDEMGIELICAFHINSIRNPLIMSSIAFKCIQN